MGVVGTVSVHARCGYRLLHYEYTKGTSETMESDYNSDGDWERREIIREWM